jgi:hypothetical protein
LNKISKVQCSKLCLLCACGLGICLGSHSLPICAQLICLCFLLLTLNFYIMRLKINRLEFIFVYDEDDVDGDAVYFSLHNVSFPIFSFI